MKIVSIIGLLFCAYTVIAEERTDVEERILPLGQATSLRAKVIEADITVQSHDEDVVRLLIHRTLKNVPEAEVPKVLKALKTKFQPETDVITLTDHFPHNAREWKEATGRKRVNFHVHYELWVPKSFSLDMRTVDGDMLVGEIDGDCKLTSVDGDVVVEKAGASVRVNSTDGDILIKSVMGTVKANTVDGDIMIKGSSDITANTTDGDIMVDLLGDPEADCILSAIDGDILLNLESSVAVRILAQTVDGKVYREIPLDDELATGGQVLGIRNGGSQKVLLNSVDGDIIIRELK